MVFSRFWYLVVGVALAGAMFVAYVATGVANHGVQRASSRLLDATSVAASLYLKDDATRRANALAPLSVSSAVSDALRKAQSADSVKDIDAGLRDKATKALRAFREQKQDFPAFDAVWAIDVNGRVIASDNFERGTSGEGFEMGGYPVVADALHGYIRDDSWLLGEELWRVVARPVESEAGASPVGAIVAGKKVDEALARDVVEHTGSPVVFYAAGKSIVKSVPTTGDHHLVGLSASDIEKLGKPGADEGYLEQGRSKAMLVREEAGYDVRAVFSRLPGEAWELGAGFAVMEQHPRIVSPTDFPSLASDDDKRAVPMGLLGLIAAAVAVVGVALSWLEHTGPLRGFRRGLEVLANKGTPADSLKPASFRGPYKQLAALVNDGLDKVASSAGVERGPADLQRVLGPLPAEPTMSAFGSTPAKAKPAPTSGAPKPEPEVEEKAEAPGDDIPPPTLLKKSAPRIETSSSEELEGAGAEPAEPASLPPDEALESRDLATTTERAEDEGKQWRRVYAEFVGLKKKLGEPVDKLTFEKFAGTLQRNKEAVIARHGCERVVFRVYEKDGRAALKASPLK